MTLLCAVVHGTTKLQDKLRDVMLAEKTTKRVSSGL